MGLSCRGWTRIAPLPALDSESGVETEPGMDAPRMIRRRLLACAGGLPSLLLGGRSARAAGPAEPRRIALVIGNGRYAQARARQPGERCAAAVATTHAPLQFRGRPSTSTWRRATSGACCATSRGGWTSDDSAAVFFYAGHGMQIDRRNYLLPVDLNLRDEDEVQATRRSISRSASQPHRPAVEHAARIFIIDACRDNPFGPARAASVAVLRAAWPRWPRRAR